MILDANKDNSIIKENLWVKNATIIKAHKVVSIDLSRVSIVHRRETGLFHELDRIQGLLSKNFKLHIKQVHQCRCNDGHCYKMKGTTAFRFSGYVGKFVLYHLWCAMPRGIKLAAVYAANATDASEKLQAIQKPVHSTISPK